MADRAAPATGVDPRLLRSFVVLAEELHFGRAAARLHVAQPAVSQQLQRLEAQVGAQLVSRSRHDVSLTDVGTAVLPYARQAVAAAAALERVARELAAGGAATLRIGLSPGVHYLAERILAQFAREHPALRVRALADNTGVLAREVAAGRLEVAFGFAPSPVAGVRCEALVDEAAVVAIAETHPLAGRPQIALHELARERFALVDPDGGEGYNEALRRLCRHAGFEPRTTIDPSGPMAWESAVRNDGCVGLTTRASAASTLRGLTAVALSDAATFRLELLQPDGVEGAGGYADAFVEAALRIARGTAPTSALRAVS